MKELRLWYIPQIPGKPFEVEVKNIEEAKKIGKTLIAFSKFEFENNIKPDYSDAIGLEEYDEEKGEWFEYENENGQDLSSLI